MPLSDLQIRTAKPAPKPVKLTDGHGLYIEIKPTGSKLWRYRFKLSGKETTLALGQYPEVSLADAREAHREARALVRQGINPSHRRKAEKLARTVAAAATFETIAREWVGQRKGKWSQGYLDQVETTLAADVYPYVGKLPIRAVTAAHLLAVIRPIEARGSHSVAILVRQWCGAVFRFAIVTLRADVDHAAALKGAVQRPRVTHSRPLPRDELTAFVRALDSYGGERSTVIALRLLLLTIVRTGELRGARWEEIDFDKALWRIPAARMKARAEHLVPLAPQAVAALRELHTLTGSGDLLFPHRDRPGDCMGAATMNAAIMRMGFSFSAHCIRATASTMLNEMNFRADVIERALAHADRDRVRASYNRAEYLEERRAMLCQWADLLDQAHGTSATVVPIRA